MQIQFDYGQSTLPLEIPEANLAGLIVPCQDRADYTQNSSILTQAIQDELSDFQHCISGRRVALLLPDATRDLPVEDCLKTIIPHLRKASSIISILCTGTHTAQTRNNIALAESVGRICTAAGLTQHHTHIHDCQIDTFIDAGFTSRQTHIRYNAAIRDTDVFVVLSDVKAHYFAGYSNPVKYFVPGLCDYETARGNHSLTLDNASIFCAHPYHSDSSRQNQPLAADQVEAMDIILQDRPAYALTTISSHQAIQWAAFGLLREVCAKAFTQADQWNLHSVSPVDRMIVSPGGFPNDMDLYIAQRALELTEQAVTDGGEILFLSACEHGIGPEQSMAHFWNLLIRPISEIEQAVTGHYKLFSHKPLRFARLIQRLNVLWVYSQLAPAQITAAHMNPTDNPQTIIDQWIRDTPTVQILAVNGANKLALKKK